MSRRTASIGALVLVVAIVSSVALLRNDGAAPLSFQSERIAVLTDLTSYTAEYGQQEYAGLQLLAEDMAASTPSHKVDIDVQDTKGRPQDALNGLSQILSKPRKPVMLFAALSSVSTAVLPTADKAALLTLCNATSDSPLKLSQNAVRNFPSPEAEFASLYEGAVAPLALSRLGMLVINDEYGQSMSALFRARAGVAGVLNEAYGFDATDFRPVLTRVRAANLDGLIVVGYGSQAGSLIRQLREGGFMGRILVPSLIVNTDSVVEAGGDNLQGVIFNGFTYLHDDPRTRSLLQRFQSKYKGRQSDIGVLAYVGAKIVMEHTRPGATPAETIAALQAAQPFDTILGKVGMKGRSFLYDLELYEVSTAGVIPFSPVR